MQILIVVSMCLYWANAIRAQETTVPANRSFNIAGRVIEKSKYGFKVETRDGKRIEITVNEETDFALRMSRPSFKMGNGQVAVDGPTLGDGQRKRVRLDLPEGQLYLLVEFRSENQRKRVMSKTPWRLNNYLIGNQRIESSMPNGSEVLLSGEVDLEASELRIGGSRYPIKLGFRGATLGARSIADIEAGRTIVSVSGTEAGDTKLAKTVLFLIR